MTDLARQKATKDEFIGTIYGTAALVAVTMIQTGNALDALEERTNYLRKKSLADCMTIACRDIENVSKTIERQLFRQEYRSWVADFGNATYGQIEPHIERLQFAIANRLGRLDGLQSTLAVATLMVAQSLAHETVSYVAHRKALFRNCRMENQRGRVVSASNMIDGFSLRLADSELKKLIVGIMRPIAPDGLDLLTDRDVLNGLKAVLNVIGRQETWQRAKDKAEELNGITNRQ